MWQYKLLTASEKIEIIFFVLTLISIGLLSYIRLKFPDSKNEPYVKGAASSISFRQETICIGFIIAGALAVRLIGWNTMLTPPFYFSQGHMLYVENALQKGDLWNQWLTLLRGFSKVDLPSESAIFMPISMAFQSVFGPFMQLPLIIGACWGTLTVILSWLLGRKIHSVLFGLLLSSFVAISPLQIVWSRIGSTVIAAGTYVVLAILLGYFAGKRRSFFLSVLTGIAAWGALYMYYAARVAIPLALIAMIAGMLENGRQIGILKKCLILISTAIVFVGIYGTFGVKDAKKAFWPNYGGYVGTKGEKSIKDLITSNVASVKQQFLLSLEKYFVRDRKSYEYPRTGIKWEMQNAGLSFFSVTILGIIGLIYVCVHIKKHFLWIFLGLAGISITSLSHITARRFIVFDLAWCAFAAFGIIAILSTKFFTFRKTGVVVICFILLQGAWSFGTIYLLNSVLAHNAVPIPFGESGFYDGLTCKRCMNVALEWKKDIEKNHMVVLFDTDLQRENRTSPAGLALYGKLAALAAGRKDHFLQFYPIVQNFDIEPTVSGGYIYDPKQMDFLSFLIEKIVKIQPSVIIWHFETPTQWEMWLADRLVNAGGIMVSFETPLSKTPGIQVKILYENIDNVFKLFQEITYRPAHTENVSLKIVDISPVQIHPILLASLNAENKESKPEWILGNWHHVKFKDELLHFFENSVITSEKKESEEILWHMSKKGNSTAYHFPSKDIKRSNFPENIEIGCGCGVRAADHWWIADPVTGKVHTTYQPHVLNQDNYKWIGISQKNDREIMLASADQNIYIYDIIQQQIIQKFPASVWQTRRMYFGECATMLYGNGWYATFDQLLSLVNFYDLTGQHTATVRLDQFLKIPNHVILSLAGSGDYIGIGLNNLNVVTVKVQLDSYVEDHIAGSEIK